MLELFNKSNIRKRIVLLFVYNPKKEFYLSEIARAVGTSAGTAQRELNRLLKSDLVIFKKKDRLSFYTLNMRYSLLKEIEAIIKKTIGIEEELKSLLNKIRGIKYAFLFGSYVKGGIKSSSDIDLFIVGDADDDLVYNSIRQVENIVGRDINYHLAAEKEFIRALRKQSFVKEITKYYILLIGEARGFRKLIKRSN